MGEGLGDTNGEGGGGGGGEMERRRGRKGKRIKTRVVLCYPTGSTS